jgi:UDP:flavonoid glycosyltransferase YjiC (YdhE family)
VSGRFLFVTGNGGGNSAPTYPLVRCLVKRGHTVTVLGQAAQGEAARKLGAEFVVRQESRREDGEDDVKLKPFVETQQIRHRPMSSGFGLLPSNWSHLARFKSGR